jgi:hypothetical protein
VLTEGERVLRRRHVRRSANSPIAELIVGGNAVEVPANEQGDRSNGSTEVKALHVHLDHLGRRSRP